MADNARRVLLGFLAACALAGACERYNDENGGDIHTDPRTLDRVCVAGGCKPTGQTSVVDGLTEGTLAYQIGPGGGALELDMTQVNVDFGGDPFPPDAQVKDAAPDARVGPARSAPWVPRFEALVAGSGLLDVTCKGCDPGSIAVGSAPRWLTVGPVAGKVTLKTNGTDRVIVYDVRMTSTTDGPPGCSISR